MADALAGNEDLTIDDLQYGGAASNWNYRVFGRGFKRRHEDHSDGINEDNWHQERLGFRADGGRGRNIYFLSGDLYKGDSPQISENNALGYAGFGRRHQCALGT